MFAEYLRSIQSGMASLAFNKSCLACDKPVTPLCNDCSRFWIPKPASSREMGYPVHHVIAYGEIASQIVLLAKENGITAARTLLAQAISLSLNNLIIDERISGKVIALVPIPTTRKARRSRGGNFLESICREVIRDLAPQFSRNTFVLRNLLRVRRSVKDQSSLNSIERSRNLSGAFEVFRMIPATHQVVVIDDVVTTGSTLQEAFRALKERNLTVLGAATACASRRRQPIR